MNNFTRELAITPHEVTKDYPVDFDKVWSHLGYARKGACLKALKCKFKQGKDFIYLEDKISSNGRPSHSIALSTDCFQQMTAMRTRMKPSETKEKIIKKTINSQIRGRSEVLTPAGKIDLLTPTDLIEVKEVKNWKSALGQILAYGFYYPSHRKVIYLFGSCHLSFRQMIQQVYDKNDVVLVWIDLDICEQEELTMLPSF